MPVYSLYSKSTRDNGWCFIESSPYRAKLQSQINALVGVLYPAELREAAMSNYRIIEQ